MLFEKKVKKKFKLKIDNIFLNYCPNRKKNVERIKNMEKLIEKVKDQE